MQHIARTAVNLVKPYRLKSFLFLIFTKPHIGSPRRSNQNCNLLCNPLELSVNKTNIALTVKTTYKVCLTGGIFVSAMRTTHCLLDTGAGVNIIHFSVLPSSWNHYMKRDSKQKMRTVIKQSLPLDKLIFLHLHQRKLNTRVRFDVAPHPDLDTLLLSALSDCFDYGTFPSERQVVPWHSKRVAILSHTILSRNNNTFKSSSRYFENSADDSVGNDSTHDTAWVARRILLQLYTQY